MTSELEHYDGHLFGPGQRCFGCSPDHPSGFRLKFAKVGDRVETVFVPGQNHQGPPGIMHGGLVSTLADEVAAWAVIAVAGKAGFTASFDAKLHKPVRIDVPVTGRAWITRDARRIIDVAVELIQPCGESEASSDSQGAERSEVQDAAHVSDSGLSRHQEHPSRNQDQESAARGESSGAAPSQRCFSGSFRFVVLDRKGAERMIGSDLPPSWERFCR